MMNPIGLDPVRFTVACANDEDNIVGFGQMINQGGKMYELRSLFVKEEHRKKGVGSEIARRLLSTRGGKDVWLLTAKYSTSFYEQLGFHVVPPWQLPRHMLPDVAIGSVVLAMVARTNIIGMALTGGGGRGAGQLSGSESIMEQAISASEPTDRKIM